MPQFHFVHYASQMFWFFCAFGLFSTVIKFFVYPRVDLILSSRRLRIDSVLNDAKSALSEASELRLQIKKNEKRFFQSLLELDAHIALSVKKLEKDAASDIAGRVESFLAEEMVQLSNDLNSYSVEVKDVAIDIADMIHNSLHGDLAFLPSSLHRRTFDAEMTL